MEPMTEDQRLQALSNNELMAELKRALRYRQDPLGYNYRVQAWLPNSRMQPQEFGMNSLQHAISAARDIAGDTTFWKTVVVDQNGVEWAHFLSEHRGPRKR
jgi:hypothetical protein